jgi:acyl carrier protein
VKQKGDILLCVQTLASDLFGCQPEQVQATTTAADIPNWDSMRHVLFVMGVEQEFGVRFNMRSIDGITNGRRFVRVSSGVDPMSRPVIIGAGGCIIQTILQQFATIPGLTDKVDLHMSQITAAGRSALAPDLLERCVVVIEEAVPWQGWRVLEPDEKRQLPASCITASVPTLHFNTLWPLMTEDPRNVPEPNAPYGGGPFGMGDRVALKLVQTLPREARRAAYDASDVLTIANLARYHDLETHNFFMREQDCSVRVAAYVMAHFHEKRLFYTNAHPTGELMYFVLAQLYGIPAISDLIDLPYDDLVSRAKAWSVESYVFVGEEAPIHPAVATYFGLNWWHRDLRYEWLNERRSFDEWIDFYLTYEPRLGAQQ